ncbi:MAG: DNA translocase FtsK 4TM domain-containing protein [Hyphomicrobiaceae bacterium]|nr:DNA translocase FtsK 4TM domain-containing protein [Hyphomicrobiaceae bacterium]
MALTGTSTARKRLLPGALESGLKRTTWWVAGVGLFALAVASWASLMSWSIHDPSLNNATRGAPTNWLGGWGATVADLSIQSVGLCSIALFLPLAAWGRHIAFCQIPPRARLRLAAWPAGVIVLAGGLSVLPEPSAWPLPNGLGGIMGDLTLSASSFVLGLLPWNLGRLVAGTLLLVGGVALILFASGISRSTFETLRGTPKAGAQGWGTRLANAASGIGALFRTATDRFGRRSTEIDAFGESYDGYDDAPEPVAFEYDPSTANGLDADDPLPKFLRREQEEAQVDPAGRIEPYFADARTPQMTSAADHGIAAPEPEIPVEMQSPPNEAPREVLHIAPRAKAVALAATFSLPPLKLLKRATSSRRNSGVNKATLQENARLLEEVLQDFGVKGEITNVSPGPVVTLYELEPAPGTKSSRVIGLADDIARSMSAISARVAVIPGRNAIGIELPNARREMVFLRELFEANEFTNSESELALALGKNIGGESVFVDLARMPHLLVAGTTGSGKSVAINTMILSLLQRLDPSKCKFIMIDPKMLELSVYDGIPHLLAPVVTEPKKAVVALKWTVKEMEERYKRMSKLGVRNINGYNERVREAHEKGEVLTRTVQTGFDKETGEAVYEKEEMDYDPMPYIVVIVDEMADLMMVAGKDIEGAVQRLAQMARAAGIHLITATQRPSVDVVTGTIKANFPTRISFQVTSKVDSRTILGEQGAEQLLGQGDMLYMAGGGRIMRVHGPFVSDDEVEKVVRFLKKQGVPEYLEAITTDEDEEAAALGGSGGDSEANSLYDQAVAIVLRDRKASTSYIQRRLSIGYNRAATLIEQMEEEGVISAANHAGKREILAGEHEQI